MVLTKLYNEFKDINNEVANIHYGGCGVFAELVYNTLVKLGYKPNIITMSCTIEHLENIIKNIDNIDYDNFESSVGYYLDIRHIVIELDGLYIDNNGVYNNTNDIKHCNDVSSTALLTIDILEVWNKKVQWNSRFNRSQIYLIEQKLNKCYERFEKDLVESK